MEVANARDHRTDTHRERAGTCSESAVAGNRTIEFCFGGYGNAGPARRFAIRRRSRPGALGGALMTVRSINGKQGECVWTDMEGQPDMESLPMDVLQKF